MTKKHTRPKRSNSYDPALREVIAWRIAEARKNAYPDRGSLTTCAAEFGISPQQWSQYESGHRSPEDHNLERIAAHLKTTVETLMTPPVDWHLIREEWVVKRARRSKNNKPKRMSRSQRILEETRVILGVTPGQSRLPHSLPIPPDRPEDKIAPHIPVAANHESHSSKTLELIQKIITVDKLRSEGKISTENLTSTLKSVDVLIDALCREVDS